MQGVCPPKLCMCAGTRSQSTRCVPYIFAYKAADGRDVTVHIVDTPGLSDTEGIAFRQVDCADCYN